MTMNFYFRYRDLVSMFRFTISILFLSSCHHDGKGGYHVCTAISLGNEGHRSVTMEGFILILGSMGEGFVRFTTTGVEEV